MECRAEDCQKEIDDYWENKDFCDECFDNKVMQGKMDSKTGEYTESDNSQKSDSEVETNND